MTDPSIDPLDLPAAAADAAARNASALIDVETDLSHVATMMMSLI
jgi:hypothetical protein